MDQPFDGQAETRDGGANRIDQKRHVVVDNRQAQMPVILGPADAFQRKVRLAFFAFHRTSQGKACGFLAGGLVKPDILAGQRAFAESRYELHFETLDVFGCLRGIFFAVDRHFAPRVDQDESGARHHRNAMRLFPHTLKGLAGAFQIWAGE